MCGIYITIGQQDSKVLFISLAGDLRLEIRRPLVMGVVNCTPDSFAVRSETTEKAIETARRMIDEGADIIDIGGESSRPGSEPVLPQTEMDRVIPVIEKIRSFSDIPVSIDTCKAVVAEKALTAGANIINDISALSFDDQMADTAVRFGAPVVLMHMKGEPRTMQKAPYYDDVINEIADFFERRIEFAVGTGIQMEKLILDPGIGFGKRLEDNLMIIKHLSEFKKFDLPVLIGASRKSFIGKLTGESTDERVEGSLAAATLAVMNGADIIRVHDVAQTVKAITLARADREV